MRWRYRPASVAIRAPANSKGWPMRQCSRRGIRAAHLQCHPTGPGAAAGRTTATPTQEEIGSHSVVDCLESTPLLLDSDLSTTVHWHHHRQRLGARRRWLRDRSCSRLKQVEKQASNSTDSSNSRPPHGLPKLPDGNSFDANQPRQGGIRDAHFLLSKVRLRGNQGFQNLVARRCPNCVGFVLI